MEQIPVEFSQRPKVLAGAGVPEVVGCPGAWPELVLDSPHGHRHPSIAGEGALACVHPPFFWRRLKFDLTERLAGGRVTEGQRVGEMEIKEFLPIEGESNPAPTRKRPEFLPGRRIPEVGRPRVE